MDRIDGQGLIILGHEKLKKTDNYPPYFTYIMLLICFKHSNFSR